MCFYSTTVAIAAMQSIVQLLLLLLESMHNYSPSEELVSVPAGVLSSVALSLQLLALPPTQCKTMQRE
eukprot:8359-Heterococcus_DN1.PRE.3